MSKELQISEIRNIIKSDVMEKKEVFNALAQNTFKGLAPENIPKALLEGMMRGYSIQDFITKKVYATPFWNKAEGRQDYSLVESIQEIRTKAMKSGQSGKSEPVLEFPEIKQGEKRIPISCSVTVWKKGGDERGYTSKVYFDEYSTGKNLWASKPITMISKVAEMHALRSAFPEELGDVYIEEEFEKDAIVVDGKNQDLSEYQEKINAITSLEELKKYAEENSGLGKEFDKLISDKQKELANINKEDGNS